MNNNNAYFIDEAGKIQQVGLSTESRIADDDESTVWTVTHEDGVTGEFTRYYSREEAQAVIDSFKG